MAIKAENAGKHFVVEKPMAITKEQMKDMIDAIREDRRPLVDIYEGKRPVDIILGAYESSKTGMKVEI